VTVGASKDASEAAVAVRMRVVAKKRRPWIAPLVASVMAGAVLALLLIPGVLQRATMVSPDQPLIDQQRRIVQDVNGSIERQIVELKTKSTELVCRALPGAIRITFAPPNLLPPPAQTIPVSLPIAGGPTNAAQLAEEAVVLVRTRSGNTGATGSAFFISDQLLVTSDRTVSDAGGRDAATVTIENKALGRRVAVRILARTHVSRPGDVDLALLEAPTNTSRTFLRPAGPPEKASSVRSLAFFGLDAASAGIPESAFTDGIVSSFIDLNGQTVIAHSAAIAQGNGGGPLMDLCGRAVGVNTSSPTRFGTEAGFSLAEPTAALLEFLKANGKSVSPDTTTCAPVGIAFGGPAATSPVSIPGPPVRPPG
jgi:S1-C subfamily serine protease